ncbi:hypothetical protein MKZ38_003862 [Zalerion maritima]|uniref:Uncharacterized protein n=1 Tax=Zalerion maritima TaxID=339359 RepID=A0AAD5RMD0_9PEZI|nr:hypothetical protein MKZ38_003862 [Zalerion maritima]
MATGRILKSGFAATRVMGGKSGPISLLMLLQLGLASMAFGHDDHNRNMAIPEGQTISAEPVDTTLYIHIFLNMFVYGVMFPLGMVLGMIKSRFHVPLQIVAALLALLGAILGHSHGGREFVEGNAHAVFATPLQLLLIVQITFGLYLKMHLERGINGRIRPVVRVLHSFLGKAFPVLSWTQMLLGGITALGFCQGDHVGQCAAHFTMGSVFIAYGTILAIFLVCGQAWLARTGRSQEFFDSAVIAAWGCMTTFTEQSWGTDWVKNDWQHTTMGVIWWCAGLVGLWLSKDRDGRPARNLIPGGVLLVTGWAFSAHPQELVISEKTHQMFGYSLMAAGLSRIVEIAFVCKDRPAGENGKVSSWQYVPIYMLFASGFLFMGATEEQMDLVALGGMDHVSYILVMYSMALLTFLFANMLITVYYRAQNPPSAEQEGRNEAYNNVPGGRMGGTSMDSRRARDVEEFELDELVSDDDDEDDEANDETRRLVGGRGKENGNARVSTSDEDGIGSPSTLGKNEDGRIR